MTILKIFSRLKTLTNSTYDRPSIKKITYIYDSMNRRVARTDEKGTTQYLYGNPNHPFQLTTVSSPSGSLSHYHYDDFSLLFALERDNNWYYITTDQLGTPKVVCNDNGEVIKVLEYDSFGQLITDSNPKFELHIGFAGGLIDTDTELVRFGFRDYDVVAGKWTAKDPISFSGGDGNLSRYVNNSPVNFTDPTGQFIPFLIAAFLSEEMLASLALAGIGLSLIAKRNQGIYSEISIGPIGRCPQPPDKPNSGNSSPKPPNNPTPQEIAALEAARQTAKQIAEHWREQKAVERAFADWWAKTWKFFQK